MPTYPVPTYNEESALIEQGYNIIAGVDEVGRGALAGPVIAGAAILPQYPKGSWTSHINDSKLLTPRRRETALRQMKSAGVTMHTGAASAKEIDSIGIVEATRLAMERAIQALPTVPQVLLIDALYLPDLDIPQRAIIKGDSKSLSIAAASIIAKVTRDAMMREADLAFPGYGFAQHKGYATRQHLNSLEHLCPCSIHRSTFAPVQRLLQSRA